MLTVLLAAAEPSKVPFYIAGGVLALWAVVLAAIGLSRPQFPNGAGGQRGVIGISFVLMVIAIAAGILTSP
jgi:heme A synthase